MKSAIMFSAIFLCLFCYNLIEIAAEYAGTSKAKDIINSNPGFEKGKGIKRELVEYDSKDDQALDFTVELSENEYGHFISSEYNLIKFYSPTCGACKLLKPVWQKIADSYNSSEYNIKFGNIDCTVHHRLCMDLKIEAWPTIIAYSNSKKVDSIRGFHGEDSTTNFVEEYLKKLKKNENDLGMNKSIFTDENFQKKNIPESSSSSINNALEVSDNEDKTIYSINKNSISAISSTILTDDNFKSLTSENTWIIKFVTSDCIPCEELTPIWSDITRSNFEKANNAKLFFGEVDCSKSQICNDQNIFIHPILVLFKNGLYIDQLYGLSSQEISLSINRIIDSSISPRSRLHSTLKNGNQMVPNGDHSAALDDERSLELIDPNLLDNLSSINLNHNNELLNLLSHDLDNYNGKFIELNDSNYNKKLKGELWIVYFYTRDCPACESLKSVVANFSKYSLDIINVGYVDCYKYSDICDSEVIEHFPTLKFMYNDYKLEFLQDINDPSDISKFISQIGFSKKEIYLQHSRGNGYPDNSLDFKGFESRKGELMFIYMDDSKISANNSLVKISAIISMNGNFVYYANDKKLEKYLYNSVFKKNIQTDTEKSEKSFLIAVKGDSTLLYSGNVDNITSTSQWMYQTRMSYYDDHLTKINDLNIKDILSDSNYLAVAILDPLNEEKSNKYQEKLQLTQSDIKLSPYSVLGPVKKNFKFGIMDGKSQQSLVSSLFKLSSKDLPAINETL
ncbi:Thioredoxin domain-containing protein 5 [Smittium mucronatum]|uniref:Thioredoxin domain-containing protein 5 n=1 Tax=Smittium mucronatum TaxID=133383 RepID=A0A1R0GZN0_9FUNG|nr:Thioredoxin domain-containing protein 5 [Smittium mucronatum]